MSKILLDILVVVVIVCIGGFFSGSEMALVSLREGQVRALAKRGKRGQRTARLASDPTRFFSAVQIGVTLATLVSGADGAAPPPPPPPRPWPDSSRPGWSASTCRRAGRRRCRSSS